MAEITFSNARELSPGMFWIQECIKAPGIKEWLEVSDIGHQFRTEWYRNAEELHIPINAFLLEGESETLVFDTLSRAGTNHIIEQLGEILNDRALDYIVPSHDEAPHAGNTYNIMGEFPDAKLIGCGLKGANPTLHHLEDATLVEWGDTIDLGGLTVEFVEPVFLDSSTSMWLFEHTSNTLFTVDSFGSAHLGSDCLKFTDEEQTELSADQLMQYTGRSIRWLEYVDIDKVEAELDHVFEIYQPECIAPAHGNVIKGADVKRSLEMIKDNIHWIHDHNALELFFTAAEA